MYITDAVKQAKELHPNEYSVRECIRWCDELSSDIRRNFDERYATKTVTGAASVLLPSGVDITDISKIIMDGRELDKTDLRDFGITYEYCPKGRILKKNDGSVSDFEIIYRQPYVPIRYIDMSKVLTRQYPNEYFTLHNGGGVRMTDSDIYVGDTLTITAGPNKYTVHITGIEDSYKFYYTGSSLPNVAGLGVNIYREIQDETLLPPPYDTAYIDFINAKVSLYQGDPEAYATFAAQYTEKLEDYRRYMNLNKPRVKKKIINWM